MLSLHFPQELSNQKKHREDLNDLFLKTKSSENNQEKARSLSLLLLASGMLKDLALFEKIKGELKSVLDIFKKEKKENDDKVDSELLKSMILKAMKEQDTNKKKQLHSVLKVTKKQKQESDKSENQTLKSLKEQKARVKEIEGILNSALISVESQNLVEAKRILIPFLEKLKFSEDESVLSIILTSIKKIELIRKQREDVSFFSFLVMMDGYQLLAGSFFNIKNDNKKTYSKARSILEKVEEKVTLPEQAANVLEAWTYYASYTNTKLVVNQVLEKIKKFKEKFPDRKSDVLKFCVTLLSAASAADNQKAYDEIIAIIKSYASFAEQSIVGILEEKLSNSEEEILMEIAQLNLGAVIPFNRKVKSIPESIDDKLEKINRQTEIVSPPVAEEPKKAKHSILDRQSVERLSLSSDEKLFIQTKKNFKGKKELLKSETKNLNQVKRLVANITFDIAGHYNNFKELKAGSEEKIHSKSRFNPYKRHELFFSKIQLNENKDAFLISSEIGDLLTEKQNKELHTILNVYLLKYFNKFIFVKSSNQFRLEEILEEYLKAIHHLESDKLLLDFLTVHFPSEQNEKDILIAKKLETIAMVWDAAWREKNPGKMDEEVNQYKNRQYLQSKRYFIDLEMEAQKGNVKGKINEKAIEELFESFKKDVSILDQLDVKLPQHEYREKLDNLIETIRKTQRDTLNGLTKNYYKKDPLYLTFLERVNDFPNLKRNKKYSDLNNEKDKELIAKYAYAALCENAFMVTMMKRSDGSIKVQVFDAYSPPFFDEAIEQLKNEKESQQHEHQPEEIKPAPMNEQQLSVVKKGSDIFSDSKQLMPPTYGAPKSVLFPPLNANRNDNSIAKMKENILKLDERYRSNNLVTPCIESLKKQFEKYDDAIKKNIKRDDIAQAIVRGYEDLKNNLSKINVVFLSDQVFKDCNSIVEELNKILKKTVAKGYRRM